MTLVFGLEGHEGCKVAANIIHGFDCITFANPTLCCFKSKPKEIFFKKHSNILKYEKLMQNPEQEVTNLLSHLGCQDSSPELIQLCLNTLEEDSQAKSDVLSRQKLTQAGGSKQLLPDNFKEFANEVFLRFGLPIALTTTILCFDKVKLWYDG